MAGLFPKCKAIIMFFFGLINTDRKWNLIINITTVFVRKYTIRNLGSSKDFKGLRADYYQNLKLNTNWIN